MRFGVAATACLFPLALGVVGAGVVAACGGPAFTNAAAADGGPTSSGGGSSEAGVDAGGSFCALEAGTHTFCDDFDGLPLASKWSSIDQGNGGTAATDSTVSYSPPSSLKTVAPPVLGVSRGRVIESFGTASKIVVAFEVRIDSAPKLVAATEATGDNFIEIDLGTSYAIGMNAHDQVGYFENLTPSDGGAVQTLSSKQFVATSTMASWTQIVVEIDVAHQTLSITIGGQPQLTGAPITPPTGQTVNVVVGAYLHNEASELATHYDNVTIDIAQ